MSSVGVKGIAPFNNIPFVFAEPIVVVCIDNCVFSVCEGYSPEGIAVAQASVPQDGQDGQLFKPIWDFYNELDDFPARKICDC